MSTANLEGYGQWKRKNFSMPPVGNGKRFLKRVVEMFPKVPSGMVVGTIDEIGLQEQASPMVVVEIRFISATFVGRPLNINGTETQCGEKGLGALMVAA